MGSEIPEKYQKYVMKDLPKFQVVPGHHKLAPFWITPEMFPGVKLRVAGSEASQMVGVPHADPHVHEGPEIYLAPSEEKGSLVISVEMDGEQFSVEAPFSVFVPPGVKHCFRVIKCDKPHYVLGILLTDWERPKE